MRRRHLLASVGTAVSLAGCLGGESPGTPTSERTTTTKRTTEQTTSTADTTPTADTETLALGESFETPDGGTVAVHDVRVQRTVFTQFPHVDPQTRPGKQFVVADAAVSDHTLFRDFRVVADERVLDSGVTDALAAPFEDPAGELFGVPVPAPLDADRGAVVWSDDSGARGRWPLDDDHLDALANPPEFSVESFSVPESVERGSSFTATLTVANSGSGDGTFRGELGATTLSDTPDVRAEVPAGETVTAERTVEPHYPEDEDEMTVVLNWDVDRIERVVEVV